MSAVSSAPWRTTLHVQSLSEWAPVCIGPYCQANSVRNVLFLAGQIALDPASMVLVEGGLPAEIPQVWTSARPAAPVPAQAALTTCHCAAADAAQRATRA